MIMVNNMFTTGIELTTALTNVVIFIVSIFGYIKIKNKLWKMFYLLMSIDSFLGIIAHGIVMSQTVNNILWVILTIIFTITINMFLCIFGNMKLKTNYIMSGILSIILLLLFYLGKDYLLVFSYYCLIIVIISIYFIIKKMKDKLWYLLGFASQIVGGILLLCRVSMGLINYNGIYHLFAALTLIFFYIGIKKSTK